MFKTILMWGFGALLLLQAIQIDIPEAEAVDPKEVIEAPEEIMTMFKTSCYDCHSYETKMPWYSNIAPMSWSVRSHIKKGRKWLNFQKWGSYDEEKKQKLYKGIAKSISLSMPIPMYLSLHEEAKLTRAQRISIRKWAESNIKEEN